MNLTENYGLVKPQRDEFFDIDHFNENADLVDMVMHQFQELVDEMSGELEEIAANNTDVEAHIEALNELLEEAKELAKAGVHSVNGKSGNDIVLDPADVGAVPVVRTVNGHPLTGDISLTKEDLGIQSDLAEMEDGILGAQDTADTALEAAQKAQGTADSAVEAANNAQATADAATTAAGKAQTTADTALRTAQGVNTTWSGLLPVASWSAAAPHTQTIAVSGVLASDLLDIGPVYADDVETREAQREAWNCVTYAQSGANSIQFVCDEDKPETPIQIQMRAVR